MRSCARTEGAGDHGRRGHPVANNGRGTSFGWGGEIASGAKEFGQSPTRGRTEDAAAENPQEGYGGAAGRPQPNVPIPPPAEGRQIRTELLRQVQKCGKLRHRTTPPQHCICPHQGKTASPPAHQMNVVAEIDGVKKKMANLEALLKQVLEVVLDPPSSKVVYTTDPDSNQMLGIL